MSRSFAERPRYRTTCTSSTSTVQSDVNLDKSPVFQVLNLVVPVVRYWYLEVPVPVPVPVQSTRQYWYQYWYTEGTRFGSVFRYKYVWSKKHFWPHKQAGWGRTGHTFGLFFWPHVQPKVDFLPKLRYMYEYEDGRTEFSTLKASTSTCTSWPL